MGNAAQTTPIDGQRPSVLHTVAERIRSLRSLRGISRKILAERAQVSVRHLAQVEGGTGNVSIRLLDQIAEALGVTAAELLSTPVSREHAMLADLIEALTPEQCRVAGDVIRRDVLPGANASRCVTLIGLRGAGKTTLGRELAHACDVPFLRITDLIEQRAGMPVAEVHSLSGQLGYRRYEQQAVAEALATKQGAVIEAGGSIVANHQAFNTLLNESFVVWVRATPEEHMSRVVDQGDMRPMEGRSDAMDDLLAMLEERTPLYAQAHAQLDTSDAAPEDSVSALRAITESRLRA